MKIWTFHLDPVDYTYAQAAEYPSPYSREITCPRCHQILGHNEVPLQIYWDPGSDVIADFVWVPSAWCVVAQDRVRMAFEPFGGLHAAPVDFVENPDRRLPKRKPRVKLPYQGPPLFELRPAKLVHFDREMTPTKHIQNSCGHEAWGFSGSARWKTEYDRETNTLTSRLVPREPGMGVYIREADLQGAGFFGLIESAGLLLLCTDIVRDFVLREGFTNVDFLEEGETIP